MDSTRLILTGAVSPPVPLEDLGGSALCRSVTRWEPDRLEGLSEEKKEQVAKDFESVLLNKLLDEMKNTIGDWSLDDDGACEQVQGIYTLFLARHLANTGGFGLWENIYEFITKSAGGNAAAESLDERV